MSRSMLPPAIVIGPGVVTLGVINDLAAEGVPIVHISNKKSDLALRSRWPVEKIVLDPDSDQSEQLVDQLLARSPDWDGACLLPTTDPMVRIVSHNIDKLTTRFVTPVLPWETLRSTVNKARLYEVAAAAGIPAPRILQSAEFDRAASWSCEVGFPVIIKPTETPQFFKVFHAKALEAHNEGELMRHLDAVRQHGLEVMVSEIIPGGTTNLKAYRTYIDLNGHIIAEMCSEKVRGHPPVYGVGIVQRTIPLVDDLRAYGRRLMEALNYTGYATIEFKLDSRDSTYKLMEINPRPAMVQRMFTAAGLNFAYLTYLDTLGLPLDKNYDYTAGVYCIHNSLDLYYLRRYARQGLAGLKEYLSPYFASRKAYLLPPVRDPKPFFYELKRMIRTKIHRRHRNKMLVDPSPSQGRQN